tara:strand:+ start:959 stop:1816 length:858 start_codon:yes stop_codon:yes gene_type:complete
MGGMDELTGADTETELIDHVESDVESTVDASPDPDIPASPPEFDGANFHDVELSPELHEERKSMRRSFIKAKTQQNEVRREHETLKAQVTALQTDDQAAMNYIQNRFPGYRLVPEGHDQGVNGVNGDEPTLGAGLDFLNAPVAQMIQSAIEKRIGPLEQHQQQSRNAAQYSKLQDLSTKLAERVPTWEDEQPTMVELQAFIKSNDLEHPKFGSRLEVLYDAVTKNRQVASAYSNHMKTVARSSTATSKAPRGHTDFASMILKAPKQDAYQMAIEKAEKDIASHSG